MDKHTTDIVAHLTWVGLIIALVAGDRTRSKFYLNQSLVIWLAATVLGWIPKVGWIFGLICSIFWFISIVNAIQGTEKEVPLLGQIKLLR